MAESALSTSSSRGHEDFRGALLATRGLVSYRRGHLQEGNQYYVQAIETFRGLGDSQRASRAALNLSYEQARSGQIPPSEALRLVLELQGQPHLPEEHELIKRAIEDLRNMTDP